MCLYTEAKLWGWLAAAIQLLFIRILFLSRIICTYIIDTHTQTNTRTLCMRADERERKGVRGQESKRRSEISPLENFIIVYKQSTPNLSLNANSTAQCRAHHNMVVVGAALDSTVLKVIHLLYGACTNVVREYAICACACFCTCIPWKDNSSPNQAKPNQLDVHHSTA